MFLPFLVKKPQRRQPRAASLDSARRSGRSRSPLPAAPSSGAYRALEICTIRITPQGKAGFLVSCWRSSRVASLGSAVPGDAGALRAAAPRSAPGAKVVTRAFARGCRPVLILTVNQKASLRHVQSSKAIL